MIMKWYSVRVNHNFIEDVLACSAFVAQEDMRLKYNTSDVKIVKIRAKSAKKVLTK